MHGDSGPASYVNAIAKRRNRYFGACSSQQIDRGYRLDLLKPLREDCENCPR